MKINEFGLIKEWIGRYRQNSNFTRMVTILSMDILARLSNILLLPVYLRLMSQEEYGLYNYILSIITTFSIVLNFGLYVAQTKYYSDRHAGEGRKAVLFNIFFLLTLLLMIVLIPVYVFGIDFRLVKFLFKNDIGYSGFRWSMLMATIVSIYSVILANYFVTSERIHLFRKYNLYRLIVINAVVLFCLYYFKSEKIHVRLFYTYLCEMLVLLVFISFYIREMLPVIDKKLIVNSLKLGLPIMLSAVWAMIGNYNDKFFLEKYGSPKELSYYYLAFSIANIVYMICLAVQNSWLPSFLREKDLQLNIRKTKQVITRLALGLLILGVMLVLAFYLALKFRIIADKYAPALLILPFLLLAQIISGIVLLYSNYLIYFEKTHWSMMVGIITSIIGLTGSYFLVSAWGIYGAVFSYLAVQLIYLFFYHRLIQYQLRRMVAKLII